MKVSCFVHSLGDNPIVRAKPIVNALEFMGHEVEVLGLLIGKHQGVYEPYKHSFDYKTVSTSGYTSDVLLKSHKLANLATGDVVYAFKPLLTSFYPALIYSCLGRKRLLFLDVEDDDVFSKKIDWEDGIRKNLRSIRTATGYWPGLAMHQFLGRCTGVTVSSSKLQQLYGGEIVLHGPQIRGSICAVGSERQKKLKKEYGLPPDKIVLLFAGKATQHKGFEALHEATKLPEFSRHFHIALAGKSDDELFVRLKQDVGSSCTILGMVPHEEIHKVVQAADIIPVLQSNEPYTESQIPAKLLEAMAYGRPGVVTKVGDLPELIGFPSTVCPRGWVIEDNDGDTVRAFFQKLASDIPATLDSLRKFGESAQSFHEKHSSVSAIAERLGKFEVFSCGTS